MDLFRLKSALHKNEFESNHWIRRDEVTELTCTEKRQTENTTGTRNVGEGNRNSPTTVNRCRKRSRDSADYMQKRQAETQQITWSTASATKVTASSWRRAGPPTAAPATTPAPTPAPWPARGPGLAVVQGNAAALQCGAVMADECRLGRRYVRVLNKSEPGGVNKKYVGHRLQIQTNITYLNSHDRQ